MSGPYGTGTFGTSVFGSSPLYTTKDLIDTILRNTGHTNPASETNKRVAVLSFLNNRYATVTSSRHWDWLYQTLDFNLEAPYTTGTCSVTQGSQVVTGTGTLWSANLEPNQFFVFGARQERYKILTVDSQTQITLEGEYVGDTATDGDYKVIKPIYSMPQYLEHVRAISLDGYGELVLIGTQEMRTRQQFNPSLTGFPRYATEIGRAAADGARSIEVYPSPDIKYLAQIDMGVNIMKLEDSADNYPLIPDRHRVVLYYGGLAEMFRFQKDAVSAKSAEDDFTLTYMKMLNDPQLTDSKVKFQVARNYRRSRRRRGYRVTMDRHDFGREN